ncbi:MAG: beta-ketoacyl-ACP synthase II [Bdellovibrionaceae bacterium]|nr:beta-ketoacyl-ACP synthase II [Pseudobdellovibrionaceae bacterium]
MSVGYPRRVVITGVGAITSLGLTMKETWSNLIQGKSGITRISKFDPQPFDSQIAGEVRNFNPDPFVPKKDQKKMDTFIHYALAATQMALEESGLTITEELSNQTGCFIGVGMGGLPMIEEQFQKFWEKGPSRISPFFIPGVISNLAAGQVSIAFNIKGPNFAVTSACASGAHALGEAYRYIRSGYAEVMIAGGSEATVCPLAIGGFSAMKALSTRNHEPQKASRPFDQDRDGFVLAEGCAIFVLESEEHAKKRGAQILCEFRGYGASSDAYHITSPAPEGEGGYRAMKAALSDARLNPEHIQYINAHGTSTPTGDVLETIAIKKLFGDHCKHLWISSTKSMTGHALGAAGAIESAICVYALKEQIAPPTINLEHPSPECDLDYVPHEARKGNIRHVLNNSFGFGGTNACLVFSQWN